MSLLTNAQVEGFKREGYLVAKGIIPERFVSGLRDDISRVIDKQADALLAEGKITELHRHLDFLHRATQLHAQSPDILSPLSHYAGEGIFRLITCPEILDAMGQLLGPEIVASSVYRIRPKLPFRPEGIIPWHQDSAYFDPFADGHLIVTCWVPLMNATVEAGCMEVLPRSHTQGVLRHYWAVTSAPGLSVHPDYLPETRPVPVPADVGDAVLLTNLTCHRSTENNSSLIRWAADLRYNSPAAGDYYPFEAQFLARSPSDPRKVLTEVADFARLRAEHVLPAPAVRRAWLKQAEETFIKPPPVWELP